jgi:hypothetical protein
MNKQQAQAQLREANAVYSPDQWRVIETVLTAEQDSRRPTISDLVRDDETMVLSLLTKRALCGWTIHACPSVGDTSQGFQEALARAGQLEFAACAQRKFALQQLESMADETDGTPIVFKGAANSLLYYDKESVRPSVDIDVMMKYEDVNASMPDHGAKNTARFPYQWVRHLERYHALGYPMEPHFCFVSPSIWGRHSDFLPDAEPLPGFSRILCPSTAVSLTISLAHFAHHGGRSIADILDVIQMLKADPDCLVESIPVWRVNDFVRYVLPGLTFMDSIIPLISDKQWSELYRSLDAGDQESLVKDMGLAERRRFGRLRDNWHWSRITGISIWKIVLARVIGTRHQTEFVTNLKPRQIRFWLYHLVGLPIRRAFTVWR